MEQKLKDVLHDLDDIDFKELLSSLNIANKVKWMIKKYNLSILSLSEKLFMSTDDVLQLTKGNYEITLRTISKIESLHENLECEYAQKNIEPIVNPDIKRVVIEKLG
jgi:vesicle coat complex subunit